MTAPPQAFNVFMGDFLYVALDVCIPAVLEDANAFAVSTARIGETVLYERIVL